MLLNLNNNSKNKEKKKKGIMGYEFQPIKKGNHYQLNEHTQKLLQEEFINKTATKKNQPELVVMKKNVNFETILRNYYIYSESQIVYHLANTLYLNRIFNKFSNFDFQNKAEYLIRKTDSLIYKLEKSMVNLDYKIGKLIYGYQ
jgi:hypothetical protein